ncbi:unnamed protein product [Sphagnum balticum]
MMKSSSNLRPREESQSKSSLNSIYRNRVDRQIDEGNQEYDKYKSNMANSRMDMANSRMDPYYDLEGNTGVQKRATYRPSSARR